MPQQSEADAAAKIYRLFFSLGKTRAAAGYMFEPVAHVVLRNGGTSRIMPLEESPAHTLINWKNLLSKTQLTSISLQGACQSMVKLAESVLGANPDCLSCHQREVHSRILGTTA